MICMICKVTLFLNEWLELKYLYLILIILTLIICLHTVTSFNRLITQVGIVFANGPGELGSILGRVIPKTFKMVLDSSLLNTQQYKVRIKDKVVQS